MNLQTIARVIGQSRSHILLGKEASEREVRKQPLDDFRVISFATHALVAGEIDGLSEPALALSPGTDENNRGNDGLLTAGEIASLKLDANLVILSACNTAAPDGRTSGRGLSGLADAFFLAGARALAVTQWAVFSHTAKVVGSELVAQTKAGSQTIGVAEGLRRTMVNFISGAEEDYLAHPRFWAAFVVAGDGATKPLDSIAPPVASASPINVDWEHVASNPGDAQLWALANLSTRLFAAGNLLPPEGEKRAGRYMVEITERAGMKIIAREPKIGVTGLSPVGDKMVLLGFEPTDSNAKATFRLLDRDGRPVWQYDIDSDLWNVPVGALKAGESYILISLEHDLASKPLGTSRLILTAVSQLGAKLRQERHGLPVMAGQHVPRSFAVDSEGNLILAITGHVAQRQDQLFVLSNPRTGSKTLCPVREATALLSIGTGDFRLKAHRVLLDIAVRTLRTDERRLYASAAVGPNCRSYGSVTIAEINADLEFRPMYELKGINSLEPSDFVTTDESFIVVGRLRTSVATSATRDEARNGSPRRSHWGENQWEAGEERYSAFILVIGKDGTLLADRVFADPRSRWLTKLVMLSPHRFVAVGSAFGDRGLVLGFSLNAPDDSLWGGHMQEWFRAMGAARPN